MNTDHLNLPQGYATLPVSSQGLEMMFGGVIRLKGARLGV